MVIGLFWEYRPAFVRIRVKQWGFYGSERVRHSPGEQSFFEEVLLRKRRDPFEDLRPQPIKKPGKDCPWACLVRDIMRRKSNPEKQKDQLTELDLRQSGFHLSWC
jgi:hypothetical protein